MSKLSSFSITAALADFNIQCPLNIKTKDLVNDSRTITEGDIFCAVIGSEKSAQVFIDAAIKNGAVLVIAQCELASEHGNISTAQNAEHVKIVSFYQLNDHLFTLAKNYYQQPQNNMTMIGITGTNGKTSSCQLIAMLLDLANKPCGVIGTNGAGRINALKTIVNTTPGATELHHLFTDFNQQKLSHVAMEVSSHALEQHRVSADLFDIAVFTNLSRDHLDYHQTMEKYAQAKAGMFTALSSSTDELNNCSQIAVINGDDPQAQKWLATWPSTADLIVFGRSEAVANYDQFVQATDISHHNDGVSFLLKSHLGELIIDSPLMADFNIDNLLGAIAVLLTQQLSLSEIKNSITKLQAPKGRMESFHSEDKPTAIVDYAHTPDALENALIACRQHCQGELWLVFGCGGDRDKGKRSIMGLIAEKHADQIIVTNDNPRSEDPELIAQDILSKCQQVDKITVLLDRQKAVLSALNKAKANDMVLLAGKGHEDYIIINNNKIAYNERHLVARFYQNEAVS